MENAIPQRKRQRVWVFTYYSESDLSFILNEMKGDDCIVAVDSGIDLLLKYNILPNLVIGDFDSLSVNSEEKLYVYYQVQNTQADQNGEVLKTLDSVSCDQQLNLIRVSPEKDETDTEMAINWCLKQSFNEIMIINSMQNRFDHCLGLISILESAYKQGHQIKIISEQQEMFIADHQQLLQYPVDSTFSLCPLSEKAEKVCTQNCRYPLKSETLYRDKTRGISNQISDFPAQITYESGSLLLIVQRSSEYYGVQERKSKQSGEPLSFS